MLAPAGAEFDAATFGQETRRPRLRVATPIEAPTATLAATLRDSIDTRAAISSAVRRLITVTGIGTSGPLPTRLSVDPRFERPLYERLSALSTDYLVPGLGLVPDESVGLLVTNDAFVEAILNGASHEMSREFLWRPAVTAPTTRTRST